jgi:ABC-type sulfate/molybdate transport systems ATPase subunit
VLVVEHDMSFVMSLCDELVVLNFGHQIARGAPDEVRRDPEVVAAYLGDEHGAPDEPQPPQPPPPTPVPAGTVRAAEERP